MTQVSNDKASQGYVAVTLLYIVYLVLELHMKTAL